MAEYQYTKNIRFKLIPIFEGEFQKKDKQQEYGLKDLNEVLSNFLESFDKFIYYVEEKEERKTKSLKKKIKIHRNWLKKFCKLNFYEKTKDIKQKTAHFPINRINYLKTEIDKWIEDNKKAIKEINEIQSQAEHSQKRRSEVALCIQKILSRKNFMTTFLKEVRPENKDTHINELKEKWDKIIKILEFVVTEYLPSQTAGVVVAKGSTNYYTVNKKPKDYEKTLKDLETKLNGNKYCYLQSNKKDKKEVFELKRHKEVFGKEIVFKFTSKQEKKWIFLKCKEDFNKDIYSDEYKDQYKKIKVDLNITETYELMKQFKSEQKAMFNEVMTKIANKKQEDYKIENKSFILYKDIIIEQSEFSSLEKVNELFGLFQFKHQDTYERYIELTKNIQQKGKAQERGRLFLFGKWAYFKNYANFCEEFKKIAMEKGKLTAQIKGIEKEKLEAEMTSHWSFIYKDPLTKNHYLWLIDKNEVNLTEVKKYIEKISKHRTEGNLFVFHSFTKRSLHKLCFAEESSFVKGMPNILKKQQSEIKQFSVKGENGIDKNLQKEKDRLELKFLKKVLDSDYAKTTLDLRKYDLDKVFGSETLNDFEVSLETACYKKEKYWVSPEKREELIKKFQIKEFLITSYDLERKDQEIKKKAHTELWEKFWEGRSKSAIES